MTKESMCLRSTIAPNAFSASTGPAVWFSGSVVGWAFPARLGCTGPCLRRPSVLAFNVNHSAGAKKEKTEEATPTPDAPAQKRAAKKAAEPVVETPKAPTQPETKEGHKMYKLGFVFPRPRENPERMFTKIKAQMYHVLGGNTTMVEMPIHVDDCEQTVWESLYYKNLNRGPPPLVSVHVSPFVWDDHVSECTAKYEKMKELFKEVDRLAEVNLDTKVQFLLPVPTNGDKYVGLTLLSCDTHVTNQFTRLRWGSPRCGPKVGSASAGCFR